MRGNPDEHTPRKDRADHGRQRRDRQGGGPAAGATSRDGADLLEGLLAEDRLGEVAVFAGSEAARGIPKLRMKRPSFVSTSADELATVIDGSYFAGRKADPNLAFGQVKYIGALWMAYLARQYPDRRFITVSPGNTTGTQAADGLALPLRIAAKYVMPHLGISHKLDVGARRLVDGVTDPALSSGVFYASAANTMTGPLVDQADIFPDLANPSFQDHANEAIHRFIRSLDGEELRTTDRSAPANTTLSPTRSTPARSATAGPPDHRPVAQHQRQVRQQLPPPHQVKQRRQIQ
jgi:hypothetical protein